MAPVKEKLSTLKKYCELSPSLKIVNGFIMCTSCNIEVGHRHKSDVVQHLSRKKHLDNAALEYRKKQSHITFEGHNRANYVFFLFRWGTWMRCGTYIAKNFEAFEIGLMGNWVFTVPVTNKTNFLTLPIKLNICF